MSTSSVQDTADECVQVKMSRMRLRIAERLKESQNTAAFLTTFNEIDMSALMEMRSKYKDSILKEHEVKLGFMSAFARASALALKEIPAANASIEVRVSLPSACASNVDDIYLCCRVMRSCTATTSTFPWLSQHPRVL